MTIIQHPRSGLPKLDFGGSFSDSVTDSSRMLVFGFLSLLSPELYTLRLGRASLRRALVPSEAIYISDDFL